MLDHSWLSQAVRTAMLILGSALALVAVGQESNGVEAPGVRVTDDGNRVIYSAEYFDQYNVVTARDQLTRIPGVEDLLGGGGGGGQRGFGSGGDQILIDGGRVSGKSNDVGSVLERIQARQVVQIEVIRGSVPGLDVRSQGRVVNVVLAENLSTGYGSWAASLERYAGGKLGGGGEFSYSGEAGALSYLLSLEGDLRRDSGEALDLFFTPDDTLFEKSVENESGKTNDYAISANSAYHFLNGGLVNLNGQYVREIENAREISNEFAIDSGLESLDGGELNEDREGSTDWEMGGDYQYPFADGSTWTTRFIYSRSSSEEEGLFFDLLLDESTDLEEVQREESLSIEKIVRSGYEWSLGDVHSFEAGAELAINSVEEDARLFEVEGGNLVEVTLFNQESSIEETRYEIFSNYSWQASDRLLLESSLDVEYSELRQEGADVEHSRDFVYLKPRLVLSYDLSPQVQLRGRAERKISQLDFGDFVASFVDDNNRSDVISAGNPELVPEEDWEYELSYQRQLADDGGVYTLRARYNDISGRIDRVPLAVETDEGTEIHTAPGNVGDGYRIRLEADASWRLDRLGLDGAVFDLAYRVQRSRITDPFTGEEREFNGYWNYDWALGFRQDLNWNGLSYGMEADTESASVEYDLDYEQGVKDEINLQLFVEMQPLSNLTIRLDAENLLRAEQQRERFQYEGLRSASPLERREFRTSRSGRELALSLQWVF